MDVHDYPDDLRTSVGQQPITYLSEKFQKCDVRIVPVTGTLTDRGSEYLKAVRDINSRTSDGICLRLARDELEDPVFLEHLVLTALDALVVSPSHTDIVLNFDFVGGDKPDRLRSVALEALEVISRIGPFRNVVLSGTSIPAQLGRRTQGEVLRLRRVELDVWMDVMRGLSIWGAALLSNYLTHDFRYAGKIRQIPLPQGRPALRVHLSV